MSTAVYPLGMNSKPSSGYNHHSTYNNKQYITWKGTGPNSFPVGTASGHIRPLTNNDPGNIFPTGFGLARPIKHFRKGRVIPQNRESISAPASLIDYNLNRYVKSSKGTSLGGGFGGSGLLNEMQDKPGSYIVSLNSPNEENGIIALDNNCKTCEGVGIIASYKPNLTNLLENPEPNTTNHKLCCNQEKFAKRRVIYASTNLKKNYYTTTKQYLQNRCKTYEQKAFNFLSTKPTPYYATTGENSAFKPGSPLALNNTYVANCQINSLLYENSEAAFINRILSIMLKENVITPEQIDAGINTISGLFNWIQGLPEGQKEPALVIYEVFLNNPYIEFPLSSISNPNACQLTVYKPNNYQYAKQGSVSSSTRLLKLNVDTISTNTASIQNYNNLGPLLITANQLYAGDANNYRNLLKNKAPTCNTPWPINFPQSGRFQNKRFCHIQN
jgi:hypothetical protein